MSNLPRLCFYHEPLQYANIYSLGVFDSPNKRGCIISTSKHLYRLVSRKNGEVKLINVKLTKLHGKIHKGEIEIQGVSVLYYKGFFYLAFICRSRKEGEYVFSIFVMRYRSEDSYSIDRQESLDIKYTPYKIFLVTPNQRIFEDDFILFVSGEDQIHMYFPDTLEPILTAKIATRDFLFHSAPVISTSSLWHIKYFLVALGCQNGQITLLMYKTEPFVFKNLHRICFDGPISALLLFETESEIADLLVVCAVGYCALFRDVSQDNIEKKIIIRPPCSDALTCATAVDVDFDGQKEIIIGSFSKEIFCFKIVENTAILLWKMEFLHPIMGICEIDINKDGVNEIVVLSMYGVSILALNHELACQKLRAVKRYLENSV